MVFKCCVVNCRTNYDTQRRKYPVFAFPSQPELLVQWLERIETKSNKITHSSRVCIRHFNPEDVKKTTKHRSVLMPNTVPVGVEHVIASDSESEDEKVKFEEYQLEVTETEDIIEETGITFDEFRAFVDERQDFIVENWNIYNHPSATCFYRMSNFDESLNDLNIAFKIIVSSNMKVKICRGGIEASSSELLWILPHAVLHTCEQFEEILNYYSQEPEILCNDQPLKHLRSAYEHLEQVKIYSLQEEIERVKIQLHSVMESAMQLEEIVMKFEENDAKVDDDYEKSTFVEALDGVSQQIIDEGSHYDEPMDGMEDIVIDVSQKSAKYDQESESSVHFKCQNCTMVYSSDVDFRLHANTCSTSENLKNSPKKSLKKVQKENLDETSGSRKFGVKREMKLHPCPVCSKNFKSPYTRKEHEKTHQVNPELESYLVDINGHPRYACPKCTQHFEYSFILKKHIDGNCQTYDRKRKYRYPCPKCDREFPTKISAATHASDIHKIEIGNIEKWCFECNSEFDDYVNHVRMHSCNFSCAFCGAKFLTEEKAMNHQLEKHANETENDRQFKCSEEGCGLSFKILSHLRSHQLSMHTLQQRIFQCQLCSKSFSQKTLLNAHNRTHLEHGIFCCNIPGCVRRFKKLTNLKEHAMRDHNETNIYLCKFEGCNERYKMLNDLKSHCQEEHKCSINIQKYFDNC